MLIIKLEKGDKIDKALKKYRRKVIKTKQMKKLRAGMFFEKKSQVKRKKLEKAKYIQKKYKNEES